MNLIELLRSLGLEVEGDDVTALTEDALVGATDALQAAYADAKEALDLDAAQAAVEGIEAIRAESTRRDEALAATEAQFAELDRTVAGDPEPEVVEGGEGEEPDPAAAPAVEVEVEVEVTPDAEDANAEEPELVTASTVPARTVPAIEAAHRRLQERAARRGRMPTAPAAHQGTPESRGATITAGADIMGMSPGQAFGSMEEFGRATADRIHSLQQAQRGNPNFGGRFLVASMHVDYPEDRVLTASAQENWEKIEKVTSQAQRQSIDAITAAGGLCAPTDVRYELFGVGDDRRPIRDALVRFNAARGGVRFVRPPTLSDLPTAVQVWTEANDTTPADPTTKPCLTITCGSEVEEVIDAVTQCLRVGNFSRRTFPEQFARWWTLAGVQHAREAEAQLWTRMLADVGVLDVTTGELLGAARDVLENLRQAGAAYRSRRRMDPDAVLRVIMPDWTLDIIAADLVRQLPGDSTLGTTRADADRLIRAANIAPTYTPDVLTFAAQTDGAALLRWPDTVEMLMFAEGTYLYLDGGQLDFGMEIRDSTLNSLNDSQAFMETFEGEAFIGNEAIHLVLQICPDGSSSAAIDISPCTTGS